MAVVSLFGLVSVACSSAPEDLVVQDDGTEALGVEESAVALPGTGGKDCFPSCSTADFKTHLGVDPGSIKKPSDAAGVCTKIFNIIKDPNNVRTDCGKACEGAYYKPNTKVCVGFADGCVAAKQTCYPLNCLNPSKWNACLDQVMYFCQLNSLGGFAGGIHSVLDSKYKPQQGNPSYTDQEVACLKAWGHDPVPK